MTDLEPTHILQVSMGFFAPKTLLSAVELGLFTELAKRPMNAGEIREILGLHLRAVPDFPDALVALKFLQRDGEGPGAVYANTPETAVFLDRNSPDYAARLVSASLRSFHLQAHRALPSPISKASL
jgi:hypothetical protein